MAQQGMTHMIAVMGARGSGKSTFINLVSGSNFSVEEWKDVEVVDESKRFILDGQPVTLIDTPGFDSGIRYDLEILDWISLYLRQKYGPRAKLAGILYLHSVSDRELIGTTEFTIPLFRTLCGQDTLSKVIVVTTKWDKVDPAVGKKRERQLMTSDDLFKLVLDQGGKLLRFDGTIGSAEAILRRLIPPVVDGGNYSPNSEVARLAARVGRLEEEVKALRDEMDEMRETLVKDSAKEKSWFSWW